MADIFISHVEEDASFAIDIAHAIERIGFITWYYERDTVPGRAYLLQIGEEIDACRAIILLISSHSLGSYQIRQEVVRACESNKPFIPLLIDVSHAEFQTRQPEWRAALGATTSLQIPHEGISPIVPQLAKGLAALGIQSTSPLDKAPQQNRGSAPKEVKHIAQSLDAMSSPESSTPEHLSPAAPPSDRRWGLTLLWILPALALLLVFVYGFLTREPADSGDSAPRIGKLLADFTLPDLQGHAVQLAALRGKVVFVNVWATWCPPCIEEMPTIQQLYERLHGRGLEILAVSLDALGAQVVAPFMQSRRLSFPTLLDPKNLVQRLYRTTGVPESFIVDKRGILVEKVVGPRDWVHPQLLAQFERLLAMPVTN